MIREQIEEIINNLRINNRDITIADLEGIQISDDQKHEFIRDYTNLLMGMVAMNGTPYQAKITEFLDGFNFTIIYPNN